MAVAAALLALALAGGPAAAGRVQTQLRVEATVLPACTVTSAPMERSDAAFTCTHGERPKLAVGASSASLQPPAAGAEPRPAADIKVVTLTY